MKEQTGWKPIPLSLKILSCVFLLWVLGSIMAVSMRYEQGLPIMGVWVSGLLAARVVVLLDIIGPLVFLVGLWNRKSWAVTWAIAYNGLFVLNSAVAFFTFRDTLGAMPIMIPTLISLIFVTVIYRSREYFML